MRDVTFERQAMLSFFYRGELIESAYRMDLFVDKRLVVEIKAIDALLPIHQAQLLTYLKLSGLRLGLLINFNVPLMRNGIKRMVRSQ